MLARLFRFEYPNHWSLQATIRGGQPGARERAANRLKFFTVNFLFLALLVHHDQAPGYTDPCRPISGETNLVNGGRFQIRKFIRVALPEGLLRLQSETAKINSDDRLRAMPSNLDGSPDNPLAF